jgi:CBS domain-containing protein
MNVGQLCNRAVVSVQANATLAEVARLMRDRHVGAIVVLDAQSQHPTGIVTDRDILRVQLQGTRDLSEEAASQVMTTDLLVLHEDMDIDEAIDRMQLHGVRRAPVRGAAGRLVGILSTDDLIAHVARELSSLARLLAVQPTVERISASLS